MGACFLTTIVTEPIKAVSVGFPALGEDMDVVDAEGNSDRAARSASSSAAGRGPG